MRPGIYPAPLSWNHCCFLSYPYLVISPDVSWHVKKYGLCHRCIFAEGDHSQAPVAVFQRPSQHVNPYKSEACGKHSLQNPANRTPPYPPPLRSEYIALTIKREPDIFQITLLCLPYRIATETKPDDGCGRNRS